MNPLSLLFGQQSAAPMAGTASNPLEGNPIEVTGQTAQDIYEDFTLNNRDAILERDSIAREGAEASDRSGIFGAKGTLRDILGVLGDAFIIQSGNAPMYAPRRQQERMSDAMAGFTRDPIAAAERATGVDAGFGTEFFNNVQGSQIAGQNAETQARRAATGNADLARKTFNDALATASQMMATAVTSGDPTLIAQATQGIELLAQQTGVPVEALMAGVDPRLIAGRGATVSQNLRLPLEERRVSVSEGQLDVARQRAEQYARSLDIREGSERWDRLMDAVGVGQDAMVEEGRNRRAAEGSRGGRRPRASTTSPVSGLQIRPVGQ